MKLTIRTLFAIILIGLMALPVQAAPAVQSGGPCLKVASASIRTGPGGGYRRVGVVSKGECITVLGLSPDGNWYQIPGGWVWAVPYLWTQGTGQLVAIPGVPPTTTTTTTTTTTGGQAVTAQSWVSENAPAPFGDVVAYAQIFVDGAPRSGIPVTFTWRFTPTAVVCTAQTDGDGVAKCLQNIGAAPVGKTVLIQVSFQVGTKAYSSTTSLVPGGNCDQAYQDFCLQAGLADLDCADIPYRAFSVLPPDPHGFDPDGNGVGCEL